MNQCSNGQGSVCSDGCRHLYRMVASPRAMRGGYNLAGNDLVFTAGSSLVVESLLPPFRTVHRRVSDLSVGLTVVSVSDGHLVFGTSNGCIGVCTIGQKEGVSEVSIVMPPTPVATNTITSISCQLISVYNTLFVALTDLVGCIVVLIDTATYNIAYKHGPSASGIKDLDALPWPEAAESSVVSHSNHEVQQYIVIFSFGTIFGLLYVYLFDLRTHMIRPLKAAAINASIGAEARCSITHLSALPVDGTTDLPAGSLSEGGAGFLLLVTLLYSRPRLLLVDITSQLIFSLLVLPLHGGQMTASSIISPSLLCTSGSDRLIHLYRIGTVNDIWDFYPLQTLGTAETEIGRGFVMLATSADYIVGVTGDCALIVYSRHQTTATDIEYMRYNVPEGHTGRISSIQIVLASNTPSEMQTMMNTLVITSSSADRRVLAYFDALPLCWAVIHGCSIYSSLVLEPRSQQNIAIVGDENVLRIITVPGWLRRCFTSSNEAFDAVQPVSTKDTSVESFLVAPLAGLPAQLTLTVSPLWTEQEVAASAFVSPPVNNHDDLKAFSRHLDVLEGVNTSSEDRLLRGTTQFPEIAECCNFPGSNCMSLCQSADGAYLATLSIAGRVTEDSTVIWEVYKPDLSVLQVERHKAGTQFAFRKVSVAKPVFGESYVGGVFFDSASGQRLSAAQRAQLHLALITEQGTLTIWAIDTKTGDQKYTHMQPFKDANSDEFTDYIESLELGIQPCICAGDRWLFASYRDMCYRYSVSYTTDTGAGVKLSDQSLVPLASSASAGCITALMYDNIHDFLFIGTQNGSIIRVRGDSIEETYTIEVGVGAITAMQILSVETGPVLVVGDELGCMYFLTDLFV